MCTIVGLAANKKQSGGGRVVEPFSEFLKTLRKPAAQDIVQHLKRSVNSETKTFLYVLFALQLNVLY